MSTVIPAESVPIASRYACMKRDFGHDGPGAGDGVLTIRELDDYIDNLEDELSRLRANGRSTRLVDVDLEDSRALRAAMLDKGADGLDYLPPQIRDANLPPNLQRRAAEVLFNDNSDRITRTMITKMKRLYSGSSRSPGSLRNASSAVGELDDLANRLGLN